MEEWFQNAWWDARKEDKEFRAEVRATFAEMSTRAEKIEQWIDREMTARDVLKAQKEIRAGRLKMFGTLVLGLATIVGVATPFLLR